MMNISKTVEVKNGNKWEIDHIDTDTLSIYQSLTNDLIAKKLNQCTYIKSVKRIPLYNGTQKITITYDNKVRAIYIIADH